ncbi:hypothetical protein DJ017_19715 [Phenylobacterium soli]|uniref:Uncharacterized protein n=1 Tax=Phenylobacterium soli TaxID=2170551 RepID=A0A328AEJ5_9CAUL|nr:hypothetical protein DJ017_19715 [Phenylobacterium soli]
MIDNAWPATARLLHSAYVEKRRAWVASHPHLLTPLPLRRGRKRTRLLPGLPEVAADSEA